MRQMPTSTLALLLTLLVIASSAAANDLMLRREQAEQRLELILQQLREKDRRGSLTPEERAALEALAERQRIEEQLLHNQHQGERALRDLQQPPTTTTPPPTSANPQNQAQQLEQQQQQLQFRIQQQLERPIP